MPEYNTEEFNKRLQKTMENLRQSMKDLRNKRWERLTNSVPEEMVEEQVIEEIPEEPVEEVQVS